MDPKENSNHDDFAASLPLPAEDSNAAGPAANPAADLIRRKVQAAYQTEPDAATEASDSAELGPAAAHSRHQKFIYQLTMSGKSLPEIQTDWHEYYAGLTDLEKHQVWEEFYAAHAQASRHGAVFQESDPKAERPITLPKEPAIPRPPAGKHRPSRHSIADMRDYVLGGTTARSKLRPVQHLQSLLFGLTVGAVAVLILMFGFFNERFIAPFIQPSRIVTDTPIINENVAVGSDPEIIIPKINVEIPVVYGVASVQESTVNKALEGGVLHYANTPVPGQNGNAVIVGHSSNNIFNQGKYKFAFVLLSRLEAGDTFYMEKDGRRYTYQVYEKRIVKPTDVSVLGARDKPATVTLITCDPPGTSTNRLVVVGEQISPDPSSNLATGNSSNLTAQTALIPGNAPSLWSRLVEWLPL